MGKLINDSIQIFSKVIKGALVTIGNTCTVIGDFNNQSKEFLTSKGEYTTNFDNIGSSAYLDIPKECTIKFAILEWHSTIANVDLNGTMIDHYKPIQFITPIGTNRLEIDISATCC